jgi:hypothetical protein
VRRCLGYTPADPGNFPMLSREGRSNRCTGLSITKTGRRGRENQDKGTVTSAIPLLGIGISLPGNQAVKKQSGTAGQICRILPSEVVVS